MLERIVNQLLRYLVFAVILHLSFNLFIADNFKLSPIDFNHSLSIIIFSDVVIDMLIYSIKRRIAKYD